MGMVFSWRRDEEDYKLPAEEQLEALITRAIHETVTHEALTETRRGRFRRSDTGRVHARPLISYLKPGEQPHFILESTEPIEIAHQGKGLEVVTPTPPYRSFVCFTENRVHLLVGQEPENWHVAIPYRTLSDFGLPPDDGDPRKVEDAVLGAVFTPKVRVQTDEEEYVFDNETELSAAGIVALGDLVKTTFLEDNWEYEALWSGIKNAEQREKEALLAEVKRRERAQQAQAERERKAAETATKRREQERLEQEQRAQAREGRIQRIVESSDSTSVTTERVGEFIELLSVDEMVDFILWSGDAEVVVLSSTGEVELMESYDLDWVAVTPERILYSMEGYEREFAYSSLEVARIETMESEYQDEASIPMLLLKSAEFLYLFEASNFALPHLQDLVKTIRERIDDNGA